MYLVKSHLKCAELSIIYCYIRIGFRIDIKLQTSMNKKKWIKTFQFLAAYLVAAWTFLQFVDWTLIRYNISPHWVDVLLWIFVGIIPSLLIYLYNQERINQRILKLREK